MLSYIITIFRFHFQATLTSQDSFSIGAVVGVLLALIFVGALVAVAVVIYLWLVLNKSIILP